MFIFQSFGICSVCPGTTNLIVLSTLQQGLENVLKIFDEHFC